MQRTVAARVPEVADAVVADAAVAAVAAFVVVAVASAAAASVDAFTAGGRRRAHGHVVAVDARDGRGCVRIVAVARGRQRCRHRWLRRHLRRLRRWGRTAGAGTADGARGRAQRACDELERWAPREL